MLSPMAPAARCHACHSLTSSSGAGSRSFLAVVLAAMLACVAARSSSGLRRAVSSPVETLNPTQGQHLIGYSDAKIKGMAAEIKSEASRASASAAQAVSLAHRVELLATENKQKLKDAQDMLTMGNLEGQKGALMAQEATEANKEVAANAATAVAAAQTLAVEEVQRMFTSKYHELEPWRRSVLTDPHETAQRASDKAAAPYDKMIGVYSTQIHKYQDEAGSRLGQARQLDVQARALDDQAEERMENNDDIGAKQDERSARAMRAEGGQLEDSAESLQNSANYMNKMIQQYVAAGLQARKRAEYEANPNAFPPLEVDPSAAYTPPPSAVTGPAPAPASAL